MSFADLMPSYLFTDALGDDVIYHSKTGPLAIKAMVEDRIEPVFATEAHVSARRKQLAVALTDAPGLKSGSKFTIASVKYTVEDIVANDGQFATCLLIRQ